MAQYIGPIPSLQSRATTTVDLTPSKSPTGASLRAANSSSRFAATLASEGTRWTEPKRTPLTAEQAQTAIADAFEAQTGRALSASGQAILTAQWAHETGHGSSMFNYNFGGIKGAGPTGLSVAQRTREGYGANERTIRDGFRAYSSAEEGARDYVQLLLNRYGAAVAAAERGDASSFVRDLKAKGYFTGDPAAYQRNIASIANQIAGGGVGASVAAPSSSAEAGFGPGSALPRLEPSTLEAATRARSRVARLVQSPVPAGLLALPLGDTSTHSPFAQADQLDATMALDMADQITRAALRIAQEDRDTDRTNGRRNER